MSADVAYVMAPKEEPELLIMKKACFVSVDVFNKYLKDQIMEIIDSDKVSIFHLSHLHLLVEHPFFFLWVTALVNRQYRMSKNSFGTHIYLDECTLLSFNTLYSDWFVPLFYSNLLPPSSEQKHLLTQFYAYHM